MKRRPAEFHYYDWDFNLWFGSETRAHCKALPGEYPMGLISNAAEGAYRNLLDYCYKQGDIPADLGGLAALCGMTPDVFQLVWPAFRHKFQVHKSKPGRLTHEMVSIRLRAWKSKQKQKSSAGASSAENRRIYKGNGINGLVNEIQQELNGRSTGVDHEVRSKKKEVRSKKKEEEETPLPLLPENRFPEIVAAYPNQTGIDAACRWYLSELGRANRPAEFPDLILAGIERWKKSSSWRNRETGELDTTFIPALHRFLGYPENGKAERRMYLENPPEWKPPSKGISQGSASSRALAEAE